MQRMETNDEKKEDLRSQVSGLLTELQTIRDEVRVRIHLAGMDLKDTWKEIEPRLEAFEQQSSEATHKIRDGAVELRDAFLALRKKLG